jgi:hypothetical protein
VNIAAQQQLDKNSIKCLSSEQTAVKFAASQRSLEEEGDLALDVLTGAVATLWNVRQLLA